MHTATCFPRFVKLFVGLIGLFFVSTQAFAASLSASPTKVSYASTPVNGSSTQYVTLTDRGGLAKISWVGLNGAQSRSFQISGITTPLNLSSGKSTTFMVKFVPKSRGNFFAILTILWGTRDRLYVPLSGSTTSGGSSIPTSGSLTISPSSFSFGNVTVGTTASRTATLTASTAAVTISGATTTNQEFTLSGLTLPATIAAGKSIQVGVNFKPGGSGSTSTQFSVSGNAKNSPGAFTASGIGVATKPHTVGLSWSPSTSSVVGYNVYRGTATGGPYSKLNGSSIVTTSFSDATVKSGSAYFYVTTAVNSTGVESSKSNEVRAVIPTP